MRSLYQCLEARYPVDNEYIYCGKGHKLGNRNVHVRQVIRGDKLVYKVCQECKDFNDMGEYEEVKSD